MDSQVDASLQNQNLRRDLRRVAKLFTSGLVSSRKSQKAVNFTHVQMTCDFINLCRLALGGQMEKNLRRLAYEFELDQRQRLVLANRR